jgi:glucose-1-phosphate cytidylyltransferase
MKVVILAGGLGTRLAPLTAVIPKPMVEIGGVPILGHIMRRYSKFGFNDFVIALGFKGEVIKRYIVDHGLLNGHVKVDFKTGQVESLGDPEAAWEVELVDTGLEAQTGARLRKLRQCVDGPFMLTYGDGLANVDISELLEFHREHGRLATLTAVRPLARFGHLVCDGDRVRRFTEKSQADEGWINGGFFVFEPEVLDFIPDGESISLEIDVLGRLAREQQLMAYRHGRFWQCMDTERDRDVLQSLWDKGDAPWL